MSAPPARPSSKPPSRSSSCAGVGPAAPLPHQRDPGPLGEADLHGEGLVPLAGPGAPWVAEFAPADLAAALGISHDAARQLLADALELAHRLPRLWDRVRAGAVPVWRARLIARDTTDLGVEAALFADRLIAATPTQDRSGPGGAARPGGPAVLRPRPRDRRRGGSPRQAWRLAAPRRRTGHHRRHDDSGHPRRAAVRPDPRPDRGDLKELGDTDDPRCPPSPRGRDPCRPPTRPGPGLRPRGCSAQPRARAAPRTSTSTSPPQTWTPTSDSTVLPPSRSSALPPPGCSPTGSPGSQQPAPRSPCAPSSTSTPTGRWTSTTHPKRCARPWCCVTRTASSPAAAATPGPATSTTSPSTYRWKTADHRARRVPEISHLCAAPTTASRPTPPGTTNASTTAAMRGPVAHRSTSTEVTSPLALSAATAPGLV